MVAVSRAAFFAMILLNQTFLAVAAGAHETECVSDTNSLLQRATKPIPTFLSFMAKYGRQYTAGSQEYEEREGLFEQRLRRVQGHNSRLERRWTAGINHLADRTEAELKQLRGWRGVRARLASGSHFVSPHSHTSFALTESQRVTLPDETSWAHLHAVRAETDQGACGSCWAVAASIALNAGAESKGINRTFAAQDLVCGVPNPHKCGGDGGCKGATVELAFFYAMEQGIKTAEDMPYQGSDTMCKTQDPSLLVHAGYEDNFHDIVAIGTHQPASANSPGPQYGFIGWERLPENKYESLLFAVSQHGPVAVSVSAGEWHMYESGIFDGCSQNAIIDHAVTLIGYGKEGHDKYWKIKNSWSSSWGENGMIKLLRNDGEETEHCGIDNQPDKGTGCEGGPSEVTVCGMCGILYDSVVPFFKASQAP